MGELNASTLNARSAEMPPPSLNEKKRKTLVARAGEPIRRPPAPALNKPAHSVGSYRQPSFASSVASSRPSSVASSRIVSTGSYTSTTSKGSRPASVQAHRSQSAMAASRIQRPQSMQCHPPSSMEAHISVPSTGRGQGNRSGRTPFSSTLLDCPENLEPSQAGMSCDTQAIPDWASSTSPVKSTRVVSLPTAVVDLPLNPWTELGSTPKVGQKRDVSITTAMGNLSLDAKEHEASFPSSIPTTPSQIPKLKAGAAAHTPARSPSKSPKKSSAPMPKFMNRNTNTLFEDFNVDGKDFNYDDRLINMEKMMVECTGKIQGATSENNGLRELVADYKARGLHLMPIWFGRY